LGVVFSYDISWRILLSSPPEGEGEGGILHFFLSFPRASLPPVKGGRNARGKEGSLGSGRLATKTL
jgi:hypothetical protein